MSRYNQLRDLIIESESGEIEKWICDFQQESGLNRVLRNVPPTKVLITRDAEYYETFKEVKASHVNYTKYPYSSPKLWGKSPFNMYAYGKRGQLLKKEIKFHGNQSHDEGVQVFDNEQECIDKYNDLIYGKIKELERERENCVDVINKGIEELKNSFVKSDYVIEKLSRE